MLAWQTPKFRLALRVTIIITLELFLFLNLSPQSDFFIEGCFPKKQACARLSLLSGNYPSNPKEAPLNALVPPLKLGKQGDKFYRSLLTILELYGNGGNIVEVRSRLEAGFPKRVFEWDDEAEIQGIEGVAFYLSYNNEKRRYTLVDKPVDGKNRITITRIDSSPNKVELVRLPGAVQVPSLQGVVVASSLPAAIDAQAQPTASSVMPQGDKAVYSGMARFVEGTQFRLGEENKETAIISLRNWLGYDDAVRKMQPLEFSDIGFVKDGEDLVEILLADYAKRQTLGVTQYEIADWLEKIRVAILERIGKVEGEHYQGAPIRHPASAFLKGLFGTYVEIDDHRFFITAGTFLGPSPMTSPLPANIKDVPSGWVYVAIDPETGLAIFFGNLNIGYMKEWGFGEGHAVAHRFTPAPLGMSFRIDPGVMQAMRGYKVSEELIEMLEIPKIEDLPLPLLEVSDELRQSAIGQDFQLLFTNMSREELIALAKVAGLIPGFEYDYFKYQSKITKVFESRDTSDPSKRSAWEGPSCLTAKGEQILVGSSPYRDHLNRGWQEFELSIEGDKAHVLMLGHQRWLIQEALSQFTKDKSLVSPTPPATPAQTESNVLLDKRNRLLRKHIQKVTSRGIKDFNLSLGWGSDYKTFDELIKAGYVVALDVSGIRPDNTGFYELHMKIMHLLDGFKAYSNHIYAQMAVQELVKNAIGHGNKMKLQHKVYIHVEIETVRGQSRVSEIHVYDLAVPDPENKYLALAQHYAFSLGGVASNREGYGREEITTSAGERIGTDAYYLLVEQEKGTDLFSATVASPQQSLAEKIRGINDELILAKSEQLGTAIDLKGLWKLLTDEEKREVARQIEAFSAQRFSKRENFEDRLARLNESLEFSHNEIYILIDHERNIVGFIDARPSDVKTDRFNILFLVTARTEEVKGRGTLLMDVLVKQLKIKGIKELSWTALQALQDSDTFYHKYLSERMDYNTGGKNFEAYLDTYGTLTETEKASQKTYLAQFIHAKDSSLPIQDKQRVRDITKQKEKGLGSFSESPTTELPFAIRFIRKAVDAMRKL